MSVPGARHSAPGAARQTAPARLPGPPGGRRGPHWGAGMPVEKSLNFGPSARRLLGRLAPERLRVYGVLALGVVSVSLAVLGPKVLGWATDVVFSGVIGSRLPAQVTKEQAVEGLRGQGQNRLADMLARMDVVPGQGIDLTRLSHILAFALGVYVASALLGWLQGYLLNDAVQRTIYRLRSDVETKLHALPLKYFDKQPRASCSAGSPTTSTTSSRRCSRP